MFSIFRRMRRRRRKKLFSCEPFFLTGRISLLRFCTGSLLLSSIVAFHVFSFMKYFDDPNGQKAPDSESLLLSEELNIKYINIHAPDDTASKEEFGKWRYGEDDEGSTKKRGQRNLMSKEGYDEEEEEEKKEDEDDVGYSKVNKIKSEWKEYPENSFFKPCLNGHIQGLNFVCDTLPCLKSLPTPKTLNSQPNTRKEPISPKRLRELSRIPGSVQPVDYTVFPFLTDMQWSLGVFGSVAEIGVSFGKLAALLSFNVNFEAGEKIFVSDSFNSTLVGLAGLSQYEVFSAYLREFGLDERPTASQKKIFVHREERLDNIKKSLLDWDIPRVRLVSIDRTSAGNDKSLLVTLEAVACLIREGGILAINGNDEAGWMEQVYSAVAAFTVKNGQATITPFLSAGTKLFLTTSSWKRVYYDYINQNELLLSQMNVARRIIYSSAFEIDIMTFDL